MVESESKLLKFDESSYSIEAIQKAAYRAMNSFTVDIERHDGSILCVLNPNQIISKDEFVKATENFKIEVLDQQLRLKLKTETESVRNMILGIVFSRTSLQNNE